MIETQKVLIILIGPPGAGKSTLAKTRFKDYFYVSQDEQGDRAHHKVFEKAVKQQDRIIVDRTNHIYTQRRHYVSQARLNGFRIKYVLLRESFHSCLVRISGRTKHPTLDSSDLKRAVDVLNRYFTFLQKPDEKEYDEIEVIGTHSNYCLDITEVCKGKRVILIGDTHGCFDELTELLALVKYKPGVDVLIFTGDFIDRGNQIMEMINFIRSTPLVFTILGNHEKKYIRFLMGSPVSVKNGLEQTIEQCSSSADPFLTAWLSSLPLMIKWKEDNFVVHAGVHPWKPIMAQNKEFLIYARAFDPNTGAFSMSGDQMWYDFPRCGKERIFFGHIPSEKADVSPYAVALDGGCVHGGVLRACVDGEEFFEIKAKKEYYPAVKPSDFEKDDESLKGFYLPTYKECQKIVQAKGEIFSERVVDLDGYKVSIFNYRLADMNDFLRPVPAEPRIKAFELRGITFVHTEDGPVRNLMMHKFFCLNQSDGYMLHQISGHVISRIQDKLDGSMIRFIKLPNGNIFAKTKGEFGNEQSKAAQSFYESDQKLNAFIRETLDNGLAAIFEFCARSNQIVIYYEQPQLVLLQLRDESTGEYLDIYNNEIVAKHGVATAKSEPKISSLEDYSDAALKTEDVEGWVVTLATGQMVKIKTAWYMARHGLLTEQLVVENSIIKLILDEQIDDAISMVSETDPRRLYAQNIREVLLAYFKDKERVISEMVADFHELQRNKKVWVELYGEHEYFSHAAMVLNRPDWKEQIYPVLKAWVLKSTYRLMEARGFLRRHGLTQETINFDTDDN
jgi:T4 RnlA family RNA ligase